jgi:hypothetical protein
MDYELCTSVKTQPALTYISHQQANIILSAIRTINIGLPQLSMHSIREMCGADDVTPPSTSSRPSTPTSPSSTSPLLLTEQANFALKHNDHTLL